MNFKMNKYCVTLEFPASPNCYSGDVDFIDVEAENEEEAIEKAKLVAIERIQVNRVQQTKSLQW
jgi:hypothetical protein